MFDGVAEPTRGAVAEAAERSLDAAVTGVEPIEEGMNAVYRVSFAERPDAVLKAGTVTEGPELLSGPVLLERVARETTLPVPEVLAVVSEGESLIDAAYVLMEYVEGRRTPHVRDLSAGARERLAREAGEHLAALHEVSYEGPYGRLVAEAGDFAIDHPFDEWPALFRAELEYGLELDGGREPAVLDAVAEELSLTEAVVAGRTPDTSILYRDYHAKNLVFAPADDADPLVRAVLDFNYRLVGDAPLDLAIAEWHLVDLPFGGTDHAADLREALRSAYVAARGGSREEYFGAAYDCYRMLPALETLNYFDHAVQFAPEGPDELAVRVAEFFEARLDARAEADVI